MTSVPLLPIGRAVVAYIFAVASSIARRINLATRGESLGTWLPLFLAVTTAVDGWVTLGPLAQSAQIVTVVLRRLREQLKSALARANEAAR